MKKIWTQVIHNLKKEKGSFVSFGIIIMFTAFMLNLALVLLFQVDNAYDEKFKSLNTAEINICIPMVQNEDGLEEQLQKITNVKEVESRKAVLLGTVVKDFRNIDFDMMTVFYNKEENRNLNRLELKEENGSKAENSVYLPLYFSVCGEFAMDEEIEYEINGVSNKYRIDGFVEEMQYGNYGKGLIGSYLTEEAFLQLAEANKDNQVMEYSIMVTDDADLKTIKNEISKLLNDKNIMMLSSCDSVSTKEARTMTCNLLILILTAFALVILLVSVFLCKFRISNSMEEEIVNMGVLKAVGYTGTMIIGSMILPYMMIAVVSSAVGIALSYVVLPALSNILTFQSGFSFTLKFDVISMICVITFLLLMVFVFTYGAATCIKKVQPIQALRGIGKEKRIKRNFFPLEKTAGNTQILLVLKQMLGCGKQNILLFFVSFVLSILVAFASTMFYNVVIEPDNFMTTLSEEVPQVIFNPTEEAADALKEELLKDDKVVKVLPYMMQTLKIDDTPVTSFICDDFNKVSNDLCYKGKNPKKNNEIALGSIFEETYKIGDTITIINGDISKEFEVTGFVQSVNFQGTVCELTQEAYESLTDKTITPSLYVYLEEDVDVEKYFEEKNIEYDDMLISSQNSQKMSETTQEMYSGITAVLIIVIFVLSMLIVFFILYIVIKSLIVQRKQELGIYKAMGYSNLQLMFQMAGSFLPITAGGVLLSSVLALWYLPYMNQMIFQTIGAMKNNMEISFVFLMVFAVLQIAMNFIISISLTMPIRKISAYSLIKE